MLSATNRFCLRKAASRVLPTSPISLSTRTRSITILTPVHLRPQPFRPAVVPLQRRWASEDSTQSKSSAQYGDNSIEAPEYAEAEDQSASLADSAKSTAGAVADKVSGAATQFSEAASSAVEAAGGKTSSQGAGDLAKSVYVGNLFFDIKEHDLRTEFSKAGNVINAKVIHDHRGLSKGFGYVDFDSAESAENAIQMFNLQSFEGRRLTVQPTLPRTRPTRRDSKHQDSVNPPSKTLFIGNMAFDLTDKDLNNLFREVKNVVDVRVAIDRRTGQPRGFAHADFVDVGSAEKAKLDLENKNVNGRYLRVDFSAKNLQDGRANFDASRA